MVKIFSFSTAEMCHGKNRQISACLECVIVKIVSSSMSGIYHSQNSPFQHGWNVSWSKQSVLARLKDWNMAWLKLSVSACLECVMVKIVSFSMSGMFHGKKCIFVQCTVAKSLFAATGFRQN
jgi:ferredoxin-like protein FixX